MRKVRITWNGSGGELSSLLVESNDDKDVTAALVELIEDSFVSPGDSFTIAEVED